MPHQHVPKIVRHSFIVRIWHQEGQAEWQGIIQHVRSGEVSMVLSIVELLAFIERRTGKLSGAGRKGLK